MGVSGYYKDWLGCFRNYNLSNENGMLLINDFIIQVFNDHYIVYFIICDGLYCICFGLVYDYYFVGTNCSIYVAVDGNDWVIFNILIDNDLFV